MFAKKLFYVLIVYCFVDWLIARETSLLFFPLGLAIEGILIVSLLIALFGLSKENRGDFNVDLFYLFLFWFIINILEVANPAGASIEGWIREIRAAAEYPFLIVWVALLIYNTNKDLDTFLLIVIVCSTLGALDGIKQLHIGLSKGDNLFLANGGAITHLIWGRLRVFSFYSEAAQFGSSQAQVGLMALILAFGPVKKKTKIILLVCAALMLYGMLISGTRGAFFALFPGAFVAIIISKKFKVLFWGGAVFVLLFCFLKFTTIGNGNYQIYRFRSSLDPNDPSLMVRFKSQRILKDYMSDLPLGGGLGVTGANGMQYNADKFLSTVQPDSYWVKVWIMYGVVGLTLWICMMTYILGKCCAYVWKIKDEGLKVKANALLSGFAGIFMCSYGNEIINTMPSTIVVYVSLAFLYKMPKLEQEINERKLVAKTE